VGCQRRCAAGAQGDRDRSAAGHRGPGRPAGEANLLKDLLPDLPRESALLVAAAQSDLASVLTGHLAQGLDLGTSSRLAAGWFAERMPFTDDACGWAVSEIAVALGADPSAVADVTLAETIPAAGASLADATATVLGWGDNDEGETDVPPGLDRVTAVAAGWYHSQRRTGQRRAGQRRAA
jgi:hypothetical protein